MTKKNKDKFYVSRTNTERFKSELAAIQMQQKSMRCHNKVIVQTKS